MNTIMTPTQKYNDLKALVKRSYADEKERNQIWEYIAGYILSPDRTQILEERLDDFTEFLGHEGRLAHIDIVVNALDTTKCDIGTSQELTRFFYIETEK